MGIHVNGLFSLIILIADVWAILEHFPKRNNHGDEGVMDGHCPVAPGIGAHHMVFLRTKIYRIATGRLLGNVVAEQLLDRQSLQL